MDSNKRNIDEFFQEQLGSMTEMPPSSVWETLEKRLDDKPSKRTPKIWWFYLLLGVMMVGGSIAAWHFSNKNNSFTDKNEFRKNTENKEPKSPSNIASTLPSSFNELENGTNETEVREINIDEKSRVEPENAKTSMISASPLLEKNILGNSPTFKKSERNTANVYKKVNIKAQNIGDKSILDANSNVAEKNKKPFNDKSQNEKQPIQNSTKAIAGNRKRQPSENNNTLPKQATITTASKPTTLTRSTQDKLKMEESKAPQKQMAKANEETIVFKPKKVTSPRREIENSNRGLSGVPEDMKAELAEDALKNVAQEEETPIVPLARKKEIVKEKIAAQTKAVEAKRAQNPLSGTPLAANSIEEITSAEPNGSEVESAARGGGGGAPASKKDKTKKPPNVAIGIKAGFEKGFQKYTSNKIVANIFTEVPLGKKMSFIFQPGVKFANTNSRFSATDETYIDAGATNSTLYDTRVDSVGFPVAYDYAYSQTYDSIVSSIISQRKFLELELPFMLRYQLDKNLSILAGMNFTFGKLIGFDSELQKFSGLTLIDSIKNSSSATAPTAPGSFAHPGSAPFSSYKDPASQFAIKPVRFGYTLGLSYSFMERVMVDIIIQQNLSGVKNISNEEIKKIYTQPYIRLSVGYSIFGKSKK